MSGTGNPNKFVTCPYNKAHVMVASRMQFHLNKCRLQYPEAPKDICPFNSTHVVNKVEMEDHVENCRDRIVVDRYVFNMGSDPPPNVLPVQNFTIADDGEENWDDPDPNQPSVLEQLAQEAKNKRILIPKLGAPPAERKAHRLNERKRHAALKDAELATTKSSAPFSTAPQTSSSVKAASSAPGLFTAPAPASDVIKTQDPTKLTQITTTAQEPTFVSRPTQSCPIQIVPHHDGKSASLGAPPDYPSSSQSKMEKKMAVLSLLQQELIPSSLGKTSPGQEFVVPSHGGGAGGSGASEPPSGFPSYPPKPEPKSSLHILVGDTDFGPPLQRAHGRGTLLPPRSSSRPTAPQSAVLMQQAVQPPAPGGTVTPSEITQSGSGPQQLGQSAETRFRNPFRKPMPEVDPGDFPIVKGRGRGFPPKEDY